MVPAEPGLPGGSGCAGRGPRWARLRPRSLDQSSDSRRGRPLGQPGGSVHVGRSTRGPWGRPTVGPAPGPSDSPGFGPRAAAARTAGARLRARGIRWPSSRARGAQGPGRPLSPGRPCAGARGGPLGTSVQPPCERRRWDPRPVGPAPSPALPDGCGPPASWRAFRSVPSRVRGHLCKVSSRHTCRALSRPALRARAALPSPPPAWILLARGLWGPPPPPTAARGALAALISWPCPAWQPRRRSLRPGHACPSHLASDTPLLATRSPCGSLMVVSSGRGAWGGGKGRDWGCPRPGVGCPHVSSCLDLRQPQFPPL